MKTYYFTFGHGQYNKDGVHMKDYWVTVEAENSDTARNLFIDYFTSVYMNDPMDFGMQYESHNFKTRHFPLGQFCKITQD